MGNYFNKKEQIFVLIIVLVILFSLGYKILAKEKINTDIEGSPESLAILEKNEIENTNNNIIEDENNLNSDIMVHISGQVNNPGLVELKLGNRVKDAVELAGGLKDKADLDRINLAKKLIDEEKIYIPKIGEENTPIVVEDTQSTDGSQSKVNINDCTKEELTGLPGVGDITAEKILKYREENLFKSIEDIMNVSGIGDKKFEDIKDMITTN